MRKLLLTTTIMLTLTHVGPDNADAAEPIGENSADETKEIFSVEMPAQPVATEMPETEAQKTEVPSTEGPSIELPSTEMPKTEQPVTEKPRTERPITEIPTTETPRTEAPTVQAPVTQVPLSERPSSETTATEQPLTKQPPLTPAPSNSQNQSETPSATRNPELVDAVEPQTDIQDGRPAKAIKVGRFHPESSEKFYKSLDKQIVDIVTKKLKPQEDKKPLHLLPETGEEKSYFAVILLMLSGISLLVFSRFKA